MHSKFRHWVGIVLLCLGQTLIAEAQVERSSAAVKSIDRVSDISSVYDPTVQLYVRGTIRLGSNRLSDSDLAVIAGELKKTPTWTIVLTDNVDREQFTASDGRTYTGLEGAQFAVGNGLFANTTFGALRDPKTGLKSRAAILLLVSPNRRNGMFFSSALQQSLGLHHKDVQNEFVGLLKTAVATSRIDEVVLSPVRAFEAKLAANIAANEQARVEQRIRAESAVESARASVGALTSLLTQFRQQWPQATGDLAHPDVSGLHGGIAVATSALIAGDFFAATQRAATVDAAAESLRQGLSKYPEGRRRLTEIQSSIESFPAMPYSGTETARINALRSRWERTRASWERGDTASGEAIAALESDVASVRESLQSAVDTATAKRVVGYAVTALLVFGIAGVLLLYRRRRNAARAIAVRELEKLESAMTAKVLGTIALEESRARFLGATRADTELRFEQQSLADATEVAKSIDRIRLLAGVLQQRVLHCKAMMSPTGVRILRDALDVGHYARVAMLLTRDPINVHPLSNEGIAL
ncbi:MAG: hypothetical protein IT290_11160, partial [Deltaproteobacteria bacterium]|nr:hypothetical protein [Deltaproteobacteria bacterium]